MSEQKKLRVIQVNTYNDSSSKLLNFEDNALIIAKEGGIYLGNSDGTTNSEPLKIAGNPNEYALKTDLDNYQEASVLYQLSILKSNADTAILARNNIKIGDIIIISDTEQGEVTSFSQANTNAIRYLKVEGKAGTYLLGITNTGTVTWVLDTLDTNSFPTMPINKGGTGAVTASAALTNLGAASAADLTALSETVDGKANASDLSNYLPLSGGKLNTNAYIEWGSSDEDNTISDWDAIKPDTGLRIISSIDENSGAPSRYSTGLHVRGRYGFQLASQGGDAANFFIRTVGTSYTPYATWKTLIHSDNLSNYALPISGGTLTGNLVTVSTTGATTANFTQQTYIIQTPLIQTGLPAGSAIQDFCKGLVKTLCTEYPNQVNTKFIGNLVCDTRGTYECYIYNTSLVDSESSLPQYAYGTVRSFTQEYYFTINNYVWKWGSENTIYAAAEKAIRANYASFDDVGNYISNSYLKLSGGKMTGPISGLTSLTSAGNITATEYGFRLSSTQYDGYIWNIAAGKGISIGLTDNGSTSPQYASLNIKGTNVYPGTTQKYNLGTSDNVWNNIYGKRITASKFVSGPYSRSSFENDITTGLQISTQIAKSDNNTAGDYGFPAADNANGVLSLKVHPASESNTNSLAWYNHYLGFSGKGLYYKNPTHNIWTKLNEPSILSISVPEIEYSSSPKILPEIINGNIVNVFHDIPQTQILIERSQDGTTWTDTTETDYARFRCAMSSGKNSLAPRVAYDASSGQIGDRVRITINGAKSYARLSHLYVYYSTQGATTKLTVEKNTYNDQNTWTTLIDKQTCTGWDGPNYYGLNNSIIGQTDGNNGYSYRITFEITAISENYSNNAAIFNLWALSSTKPYSVTGNSADMFYFDTNRWQYVSNKSITPLINANALLGSQNYKWLGVYAENFYGTNFYGTAQKATNDANGKNIADTYALASTCYGGPEGKIAVGNSDNLIGKALTNSWGIYNEHHDIIISEYDSSTETWVEKFNSTSLTSGSTNYNNFVKGLRGDFYTSTRGSKVKIAVASNSGASYVQAIGLYLKSKDTTYSGDIDYTYTTNSGNVKYSGTLGTWGNWCDITMSTQYRTSFEIIFNENEANAQLLINGFRMVTQSNDVTPILIGKSHESYKADTATRSAMVGDGTIQLYAQSGNEINFGGTNTTNPTIIFGYKSADGNQIVPTQYKFGNNAAASVCASKFITTGGTASQVVLGDGTLKAVSDFDDIKGVTAGKGLTGGGTSGSVTLNVNAYNGLVVSDNSVGANLKSTTSVGTIGSSKVYGVGLDASGYLAVNVPWEDNNTDTKVTQTERDSSNYAYPILLSELSTTGTRGVIFGTTPCINPVTHKILGIDYIQSDSSDIELITDEYVIINGTHLWPKTTNSIDIGGTNNRFKDAYFSGTVYAATSFMQSSDERLKDFGPELEVNLDELSKLRKSYFTFKDKPEDLQIGVSAQEIQKLYPEIVSETDNGYLNVDYSKLAVIALAAIDKLNEEIKELKKLINK